MSKRKKQKKSGWTPKKNKQHPPKMITAAQAKCLHGLGYKKPTACMTRAQASTEIGWLISKKKPTSYGSADGRFGRAPADKTKNWKVEDGLRVRVPQVESD
jgi:hypothetical protein